MFYLFIFKINVHYRNNVKTYFIDNIMIYNKVTIHLFAKYFGFSNKFKKIKINLVIFYLHRA